jgi:hypothetical protein
MPASKFESSPTRIAVAVALRLLFLAAALLTLLLLSAPLRAGQESGEAPIHSAASLGYNPDRDI